MQAGHSKVSLDSSVQAARLGDHARFIRDRQVGGAGGQDADLSVEPFRGEALAQHAGRGMVCGHSHTGPLRRIAQRRPVRLGHSADQSLPLPLRHRQDKPGRILRRLAGSKHHLGDAPTQIPSQVEPRPPAQLVQLHPSQLGQCILLAHLAGDQPAQDVSHSPSSTSRMRCQCVPAQ